VQSVHLHTRTYTFNLLHLHRSSLPSLILTQTRVDHSFSLTNRDGNGSRQSSTRSFGRHRLRPHAVPPASLHKPMGCHLDSDAVVPAVSDIGFSSHIGSPEQLTRTVAEAAIVLDVLCTWNTCFGGSHRIRYKTRRGFVSGSKLTRPRSHEFEALFVELPSILRLRLHIHPDLNPPIPSGLLRRTQVECLFVQPRSRSAVVPPVSISRHVRQF
jgi:hypothetical protein